MSCIFGKIIYVLHNTFECVFEGYMAEQLLCYLLALAHTHTHIIDFMGGCQGVMCLLRFLMHYAYAMLML